MYGLHQLTVTRWQEMSLEATAEDGQWRCWRDVLWKTVPDTKDGDRKNSVTDRVTFAYHYYLLYVKFRL